MKIYFVSKSKEKYQEIQQIADIKVYLLEREIAELQTTEVEKLVKAKALEAFKMVRRPVLVEHTALRIHAFQGLPGLQTSYFYSKMGYEAIMKYCDFKKDFGARAESTFCLCDGKHFIIGKGKEEGFIIGQAEYPGKEGFAWDAIFYPSEDNKEKKTYAQMGEEKNKRSMRKKAWDDLKKRLEIEPIKKMEENSEDEINELARLIKEKKVLLFLGAGISASVGLPSWNKLIEELGKKKGFEEGLFELYGNNMVLAEYANNRAGDEESGVYECIKDKLIIKDKKKLEESEIYAALLQMDFPVIYTTNYDHLLEEYYSMKKRKYAKIVNIGDMEKVEEGDTRIMKFHGDIDDKESVVLSESQYFGRMDFQNFLDVQFQADILKYHVLYLGYSLSDVNIKLMLYLAGKRWERGQKEDQKKKTRGKKSYIFTATPNMVQKTVFEIMALLHFQEMKGLTSKRQLMNF